MTHLGELLTAFVDGEVTGAEQDRITAHLVRCDRCKSEVTNLRDLKNMLAGLSGSPADAGAGLADRLLAIPELAADSNHQPQNEAVPDAARTLTSRGVKAHRLTTGRPNPGTGISMRSRQRPGGSRRPRDGRARKAKRRYVVLGAVSVMVGLGAAAYSVGGSDAGPGPRITPPVELYSEEHAITTGEVPFTGQAGVMGVAHTGPSTPAGKGSRGR